MPGSIRRSCPVPTTANTNTNGTHIVICPIYTEQRDNNLHHVEFLSRPDLPQFSGTINNNKIIKGKIWSQQNYCTRWSMTFESVKIGPIQEKHTDTHIESISGTNLLGQPCKKQIIVAKLHYYRHLIFKNTQWKFASGLTCNGDVFASVTNILIYKCDENELRRSTMYGNCHLVKYNESILEYYDLLTCLDENNTYTKNQLYKGSYIYKYNTNSSTTCPIRYEIKIEGELLQSTRYDMFGYWHRFDSSGLNSNFKWKIGNFVSDDRQSNNFLSFVNCKKNPMVSMVIRIDYDGDDGNVNIRHRYHNSSCFGTKSGNNKCIFNSDSFSFLPKNFGQLLVYFNTVQEFKNNIKNIKQCSIIFHANARLTEKNIQNFIVDMNGNCRIDYIVTLKTQRKQQVVRNTMYRGSFRNSRVSLLPYFSKLSPNKDNNSSIFVQVRNLLQCGFIFNLDNIDFTMICEKITQTNIQYILKILKMALQKNKFTVSDLINTYQNPDINSRGCLQSCVSPLSGIDDSKHVWWTKLYQSKCYHLISAVLQDRFNVLHHNAHHSQIPYYLEIDDSQGWSVFHYAAFLSDVKLLACGQRYLDNILRIYDNQRCPKYLLQNDIALGNFYCKSDKFGFLPIHIACENGNLNVVKQLMKLDLFDYLYVHTMKGVKQLKFETIEGWTPLALALKNNQVECVKFLAGLKKWDWSALRFNGWTVLTLLVHS